MFAEIPGSAQTGPIVTNDLTNPAGWIRLVTTRGGPLSFWPFWYATGLPRYAALRYVFSGRLNAILFPLDATLFPLNKSNRYSRTILLSSVAATSLSYFNANISSIMLRRKVFY